MRLTARRVLASDLVRVLDVDCRAPRSGCGAEEHNGAADVLVPRRGVFTVHRGRERLVADPGSALVLGAGGSARAAVWALRSAGADVSIWNRTPERAEALAARVVADAVAADVLVNCARVGLGRSSSPFKDLPLSADGLVDYATVVDLVYRAGGTVLIREAARRGVDTVDGLEILVRQGALSFTLWTGRAAPLDAMRAAVHDRGFEDAPCSPNQSP